MIDNRSEYEVAEIWDPDAHEKTTMTFRNRSAAKAAIAGYCPRCDTVFLKSDYSLDIGDECPGCDDYCGGTIGHFYAD